MLHYARVGVAALAIGGAMLAPTAALAADNDQQPTLLQQALRYEHRADQAITWGEHHPRNADGADDRALTWEQRADDLLADAGVADARLDAALHELGQAEQAVDTNHALAARHDEGAAEARLDAAIHQTRNDMGR